MKRIASDKLITALDWQYDKYKLSGPFVRESNKKYVSFFWFHELNWGDSAKIFVKVHKSIWSSSWRDYIWASTTMNYQWTYLELKLGNHRFGKFKDVLPKKNVVYPIDYYSVCSNHPFDFDSSRLTLEPDKLFFFLKEGYFEPLKKDETYTVVAFHEPIGKMNITTSNKVDTNITSGARIYTNDSTQLLIIPCRIPKSLWK